MKEVSFSEYLGRKIYNARIDEAAAKKRNDKAMRRSARSPVPFKVGDYVVHHRFLTVLLEVVNIGEVNTPNIGMYVRIVGTDYVEYNTCDRYKKAPKRLVKKQVR